MSDTAYVVRGRVGDLTVAVYCEAGQEFTLVGDSRGGRIIDVVDTLQWGDEILLNGKPPTLTVTAGVRLVVDEVEELA